MTADIERMIREKKATIKHIEDSHMMAKESLLKNHKEKLARLEEQLKTNS